MKYIFPILLMLVLALAGCSAAKGSENASASTDRQISQEEAKEMMTEMQDAGNPEENETEAQEKNEEKRAMKLMIGETEVPVTWEENESVKALMALTEAEPLTIQLSMYGGFEQVGPIGRSIVSDDQQTTTEAGDIVLYSGDQIVVFYGSNSWAYTRLGHVELSQEEMEDLLGKEDVELMLRVEK